MFDIEKRVRDLELESLHAAQLGTEPQPVLYRDGGVFKGLSKADQADSPLIFIASEESPDRMGDVISSEGWKLDNFRKNPVFMLSHNHAGLPIGTVPDVRVDGKQLLSAVEFDKGDPEAMLVRGKYERGVMRAVSVGFRALSFEDRVDTQGKGGLLFKESELLEISAVAVPAHPGALMRRALMQAEARKYFSIPEVKPEPKAQTGLSPEEVERVRQAIRSIAEEI